MASNPIKRRARQSFFLGFLIALVIMAIVVMLLVTRINSLNEENEKLKIVGPKVSVYTVNKDIEEGEAITVEDIEASTMQLTAKSSAINVDNYIDPSIFYTQDEETGEEVEVSYTAKVKLQAGNVVSLSMLKQGGIANDERMMEYGMVVLPTQLKNGDFIDIRLRLANGTEEIVLAKKKVEQCTANSIWMKMKEQDILTMNSAIVDAYLAQGSQLRATLYTNPLMQDAAEVNYPVNNDVLAAVYKNPNILDNAKNALSEKWMKSSNIGGSSEADLVLDRRVIDNYINETYTTNEEKSSTVEEGYTTEATDINTARSEYVSSLEGTGMVGTTTTE